MVTKQQWCLTAMTVTLDQEYDPPEALSRKGECNRNLPRWDESDGEERCIPCQHREQEAVHCHGTAPLNRKWLLNVASWEWCRCSCRQNSGRLCRDAFHSARRRWYQSVSVTLLSYESRWQWLSARATSQLRREQSLEHAESEGGAWPGSLPQHVVSACRSGLWYDVSPLRYWKSRVP